MAARAVLAVVFVGWEAYRDMAGRDRKRGRSPRAYCRGDGYADLPLNNVYVRRISGTGKDFFGSILLLFSNRIIANSYGAISCGRGVIRCPYCCSFIALKKKFCGLSISTSGFL